MALCSSLSWCPTSCPLLATPSHPVFVLPKKHPLKYKQPLPPYLGYVCILGRLPARGVVGWHYDSGASSSREPQILDRRREGVTQSREDESGDMCWFCFQWSQCPEWFLLAHTIMVKMSYLLLVYSGMIKAADDVALPCLIYVGQ